MQKIFSALIGFTLICAVAVAVNQTVSRPAAIKSDKVPSAQPPDTLSQFMPGVVSTEANDYNLSLADDGNTMVFARSDANFQNSKIMIMTRKMGRWSAPKMIDFGYGAYRDSDPWLTPDGQWLYFASARPGPDRAADRKDRDLWRSRRDLDGRWTAPQHLTNISSIADDLGPELHGKTLYFNSSRAGGTGKLDIYAAAQSNDGTFQSPSILPQPINSTASEGDFTLSREGNRAYFWSTREGKGYLYVACRRGANWEEPVRLPSPINDGDFAFTPAVSRDNHSLTFASTLERPGQPKGMADIYIFPIPINQDRWGGACGG